MSDDSIRHCAAQVSAYLCSDPAVFVTSEYLIASGQKSGKGDRFADFLAWDARSSRLYIVEVTTNKSLPKSLVRRILADWDRREGIVAALRQNGIAIGLDQLWWWVFVRKEFLGPFSAGLPDELRKRLRLTALDATLFHPDYREARRRGDEPPGAAPLRIVISEEGSQSRPVDGSGRPKSMGEAYVLGNHATSDERRSEAEMKTLREGKIGKNVARLVAQKSSIVGIAFDSAGNELCRVSGDDPDLVWTQIHREIAKADPQYFGFEGAIARFLRLFPEGMVGEAFVNRERNYKVVAKERLDRELPLDGIEGGSGFGTKAIAVYQATNLLSPFEKMRLKDALKGPDADRIVQAMARFADGDLAALSELDRLLRPHDAAKWTVVTYLPFLWNPARNMFLKPEVTKDFAARVGHDFCEHYEPTLAPAVYSSLLDLVRTTAEEIAPLKPRDNIDLQSFIWIVGEYTDADISEGSDGKT